MNSKRKKIVIRKEAAPLHKLTKNFMSHNYLFFRLYYRIVEHIF